MKTLTNNQKPKSGSGRKRTLGGQFKCTGCGERFLSLMELRAHKKKYQGPHERPRADEQPKEPVVEKIEGTLEEIKDRGYHGYRETDRSS